MILIVSTASLVRHEHLVHFGYYASRFLFLQSFKNAPGLFQQAWTAILSLKPHHALFQKGIVPKAEMGAPLGPWANSLGIAWSLSIEEYFYILWAPIVIFLRDRWKVGVAAAVIFGASIAMQYLGFTGQLDYFDFFCRIDTIMAGSMMALFLRWRSGMEVSSQRLVDTVLKTLAACLSIALAAVLLFNRPVLGHELRDSVSFMVLGLPILSVLFALALGWIVRRRGGSFFLLRALRWKPTRYLGTISYSLYLFHIPVYYCLLRCAAALRLSGYPVAFIVSAMALLLSILCSALSWKYFETPILNLKDRWAPTRARVVPEIAAN
jgi:peptidoglycan/LPS O-acetylase OafA/YrhL